MQFLKVVLSICLIILGASHQARAGFFSECQLPFTKFTTSADRIAAHGYPVESHYLENSDNYVLNLFRIPYSPKLQNRDRYRPAVLLQHGLFSNSDCWLSSGPDNSLAYLFADAGYDVWLGNARGNIYSRNNTRISLNNPRFWQFSWHEIGTIDIANMIDYILDITGQDKIHYAGHSQGTTVYFVLMSERPEYNEKVKSAHMLAPCGFLGHGTSFVFNLFNPLIGNAESMWNVVLEDTELMPHNRLLTRLIESTCGQRPVINLSPLCKNMYLWYIGDGYQNTNITSLQVLIETHPGGASSNQGIHYIQLYNSHEFRQYDWGEKRNEKIYQRKTPPEYDLSKITAPTYLYSSQNDALCVPKDVDILVSKLTHLKSDYRIPDPTWNHMDFIVANQVREELNDRIIRVASNYESIL